MDALHVMLACTLSSSIYILLVILSVLAVAHDTLHAWAHIHVTHVVAVAAVAPAVLAVAA